MAQHDQKIGDQQYLSTVGPRPQMNVDIRVVDQALQIAYAVKNTRNSPIYLFNVLWEWDQTGKYIKSANPLYVCWKQNGFIHLAKQILPLPRNRKVELRNVPFATKVEPGQEYKENLRLPFPLGEYNFYFPGDPKSKHTLTTARGVFFSLQYIGEMDGLTSTPAPVRGALQLHHQRLLARVETLQPDAVRLAVPIKKRLDPFDEF